MIGSPRCRQFGSRGNKSDRLFLVFHFFVTEAPFDSRCHIELDRFEVACAEVEPIQSGVPGPLSAP